MRKLEKPSVSLDFWEKKPKIWHVFHFPFFFSFLLWPCFTSSFFTLRVFAIISAAKIFTYCSWPQHSIINMSDSDSGDSQKSFTLQSKCWKEPKYWMDCWHKRKRKRAGTGHDCLTKEHQRDKGWNNLADPFFLFNPLKSSAASFDARFPNQVRLAKGRSFLVTSSNWML